MAESKKILLETLKNFKNNVTNILKFIENSNEISKSMLLEIGEYAKRRAEIESEYSKSMKKINDRLSEKNNKFSTQLKLSENDPEPTNSLYAFCRSIEEESVSRANTANSLCDRFNNHIFIGFNLFTELQNAKYHKCKETITSLSERLNEYIIQTHSKKQKYVESFSLEKKSCKSYTKKISKPLKSSSETKIEKLYEMYCSDILFTDCTRNNYIISSYSTESCMNMFFTQLVPEVFLLFNYKYEELCGKLKTNLVESLEESKTEFDNISRKFNQHNFSDSLDAEMMHSKFKNMFSPDFNDKSPLGFNKDDPISTCIVSERLIDHLRKEAELVDNIVKEQSVKKDELSGLVNCEKALKYDWSLCPKNQSNKEHLHEFLEKANSYLTNAKRHIDLEMCLMYSTSINQKLIELLETPHLIDRAPQNFLEVKKIFCFGANLNDHCQNFKVSIPIPLSTMISYLIKNDLLKKEGIFRTPASKQKILDFQQKLFLRGVIDKNVSHYVVASTIKKYIRELKEFISQTYISNFQSIACKELTEFLQLAETQVKEMPLIVRTLLIFLAKFIEYVSRFSEFNKMTIENLAIVLGPTIFSNIDCSNVQLHGNLNKFLHVFSENIYRIFPGEEELLTATSPSIEEGDLNTSFSGEGLNINMELTPMISDEDSSSPNVEEYTSDTTAEVTDSPIVEEALKAKDFEENTNKTIPEEKYIKLIDKEDMDAVIDESNTQKLMLINELAKKIVENITDETNVENNPPHDPVKEDSCIYVLSGNQ